MEMFNVNITVTHSRYSHSEEHLSCHLVFTLSSPSVSCSPSRSRTFNCLKPTRLISQVAQHFNSGTLYATLLILTQRQSDTFFLQCVNFCQRFIFQVQTQSSTWSHEQISVASSVGRTLKDTWPSFRSSCTRQWIKQR